MNSRLNRYNVHLLIPTIGIVLFFVLYFVSTIYYPGGSYYDRDAEGFSWLHNYWCNLMEKVSLNGEINTARPYAISATASLCFGIGYFYFLFPRYFEMRQLWKVVTKVVGVLSMIFAVFLFTAYHDTVLNIAGSLGGIAMIATLIALKRNNSYFLWWSGLLCLFLIVINNYMYYTHVYIEFLPLVQKVTLIVVLFWMMFLNITFIKISRR